MSDIQQAPDWWQASDGKWYPPQQATAAATGPDQGQAFIEITATMMPLAFLLYLFKPKGEVDGSPVQLKWRSPMQLPVGAGHHRVDVWCPYMFYPQMGRNGIELDLRPGQVAHVRWKCPWLVFLKGKISATSA